MTRRLFGIGNPDRGDDAAGWEVAARVTSWDVSRQSGDSINLITQWELDDEVVIVDAMRTGAPPGTIRKFDATEGELPIGAFTSTHMFGPAAAIELARTINMLPRSLTVYGIEIGHAEHGRQMTSEVAEAVSSVAKELQNA